MSLLGAYQNSGTALDKNLEVKSLLRVAIAILIMNKIRELYFSMS